MTLKTLSILVATSVAMLSNSAFSQDLSAKEKATLKSKLIKECQQIRDKEKREDSSLGKRGSAADPLSDLSCAQIIELSKRRNDLEKISD